MKVCFGLKRSDLYHVLRAVWF